MAYDLASVWAHAQKGNNPVSQGVLLNPGWLCPCLPQRRSHACPGPHPPCTRSWTQTPINRKPAPPITLPTAGEPGGGTRLLPRLFLGLPNTGMACWVGPTRPCPPSPPGLP